MNQHHYGCSSKVPSFSPSKVWELSSPASKVSPHYFWKETWTVTTGAPNTLVQLPPQIITWRNSSHHSRFFLSAPKGYWGHPYFIMCITTLFSYYLSVKLMPHFLTQTTPTHLSFPLPKMFLLHAAPSALNPFSFSSLSPFSFTCHHVISFHLDLEKLWVWNLTW